MAGPYTNDEFESTGPNQLGAPFSVGSASGDYYASRPYLSSNQQDLLVAALSSNDRKSSLHTNPATERHTGDAHAQSLPPLTYDMSTAEAAPPHSATVPTVPSDLDGFSLDTIDDGGSFVDFLDPDGNFEFDVGDGAVHMMGTLPDESVLAETDLDLHDKRKNPNDGRDDEDAEHKRREGDEKTAKKPGRKPLTSEPTTKRKAQNRAAQRAFRERKERHLKDLETKVSELERASESANNENGLLRAHVARLQTELREYRKRLSLAGNGLRTSPQVDNGIFSSPVKLHQVAAATSFQFDFPRFGSLPGSQKFTNGSLAKNDRDNSKPSARPPAPYQIPGLLARDDSSPAGIDSPGSPSNGSSTQLSTIPVGTADESVPSLLPNGPQSQQTWGTRGAASVSSPFGVEPSAAGPVSERSFVAAGKLEEHSPRSSTTGSGVQPRIFRFNSGSTPSNTASPSESSVSQYGQTSSCATSPESTHNSPAVGKNGDSPQGTISEIYDNVGNPAPVGISSFPTLPAIGPSTLTAPGSTSAVNGGIDWMASQNGGGFDPLLFGNYRDSQEAIVGDGDFSGGFFNDAFPFDFGSPLGLSDTQLPPSAVVPSRLSVAQSSERPHQEDDDAVATGEGRAQLLSCHEIWDNLQAQPDIAADNFDIDSLCTELKAKARCSESGVVVDKKDFDAAIQKMPPSSRSS